MRKLILLVIIISFILQPAFATEYTAPVAPEDAQEFLPQHSASFSEDLWYIVRKAIDTFMPSLSEAAGSCVSVLTICLFVSMMRGLNGLSARTVELIGALGVTTALLLPSNSLISIGINAIESISEYGKLLIPVITASLAAEGGSVTSASLYTGTILFNTIITVAITKLFVPMLYAYIAISIAKSFIGESMLESIHKFLKWLMTWVLKISVYIFTGYLGITSVITGKVDAAAVKAAKIAITGSIPVIGNVISDASETILVSASLMKNAVGTYGLLVIIALWIGPFLKIGAQYLTLKITGAVSDVFGSKQIVSIINDFTSAMGFVVAMTGTLCLLFFVSIVCFMKGAS